MHDKFDSLILVCSSKVIVEYKTKYNLSYLTNNVIRVLIRPELQS